MNKKYIKRVLAYEIDDFSRDLLKYTIKIYSFGIWKSNGLYQIENNTFPFHRIILVTNGELTYTANNQVYHLKTNDVVYTPINTLYSASCLADSNASFMYVFFEINEVHLIDEFIKMLSKNYRKFVYPAQNTKVEYFMHLLFDEYQKKYPGYYIKSNYTIALILIEILRINAYQPSTSKNNNTGLIDSSTAILSQATSFIGANLDKQLKTSDVAKICNVSASYLYKIFKSKLNTTPSNYIMEAKISMAAQLLKNTNKSVTQIASELQFSSSNHLSNAFYKQLKIRPKNYRLNKK